MVRSKVRQLVARFWALLGARSRRSHLYLRCFLLTFAAHAAVQLLQKPISVIKGDMATSMQVSLPRMGWLDFSLLFPFAVTQVALRSRIDRVGPRKAIGLALLGASALMFTFGWWHSYFLYMLVLMLSGALESVIMPSCVKALSTWHSGRGEATQLGVWGSSLFVGQLLATAMAVWFRGVLGWRHVFIVPAIIAAAVGALVLRLLRMPSSTTFINPISPPPPPPSATRAGRSSYPRDRHKRTRAHAHALAQPAPTTTTILSSSSSSSSRETKAKTSAAPSPLPAAMPPPPTTSSSTLMPSTPYPPPPTTAAGPLTMGAASTSTALPSPQPHPSTTSSHSHSLSATPTKQPPSSSSSAPGPSRAHGMPLSHSYPAQPHAPSTTNSSGSGSEQWASRGLNVKGRRTRTGNTSNNTSATTTIMSSSNGRSSPSHTTTTAATTPMYLHHSYGDPLSERHSPAVVDHSDSSWRDDGSQIPLHRSLPAMPQSSSLTSAAAAAAAETRARHVHNPATTHLVSRHHSATGGEMLESVRSSLGGDDDMGEGWSTDGAMQSAHGVVRKLLMKADGFLSGDIGASTDEESESEGEVYVLESMHKSHELTLRQVLRLPHLLSLGAIYCFVNMIRYAVHMWLPFYFQTLHSYDRLEAGYMSSTFEIGGLLGSALIGAAGERFASGRKVATCQVALIIGAISTAMFHQTAGSNPVFQSFFLLAMGACYGGVEVMISTSMAIAIGIEVDAVTSVVSVISCFGTLGAVIQAPLVAQVVRHHGTSGGSYLLAVLVTLPVVASLFARTHDRRHTRSLLTSRIAD
ncbi:hypothetical protein PTSG_00611 [Salpingoeca rosetta]|uniref:Major facilitator superfamily (MFS) profile domain-containing protein n=1 Tax=Salpingoeca rosetta (strain ATCC 50818 / BSB-021) TaxID=946362 RepID=F2TWZ3_SALR5|nr:uncharacterized protein PTSG_00611 [Salpingoeca rosetta]EGD75902.1 hypothetical protein PTSG_00611 [Salpingoeca rosetta]|eukprot:XP_004998078.1 hypothetical protein PTSG_00611 [Salpingoeca rosetta]